MTENEALMILENLKPGCGEQLVFPEGEICEAIDISISALKEIQQYRAIGTVEECREAVKKQKPMKPEEIDYNYNYYKCPVCGTCIFSEDDIDDHRYCLKCGQKIEWEESEEE